MNRVFSAFWCGLASVFCLASVSHSEENLPLDSEFSHASAEGKVSVSEMLQRLTAAISFFGPPSETDSLYFAETYAAATQRADGAELEKLGVLLGATPGNLTDFDECFSAYATARIRERVAQLAKKPLHLEWEPEAEPIPKELADAPASFRDAWRLYASVIAPYQALAYPAEKAAAALKKVPALEIDLRRVLGTPEPEAWKHLFQQVWGSWCGTGSEILYHPRNRALLLSFLADGKWHEAAGAALAQVPSMGLYGQADQLESATVDLLTALGLDWEQVMFGSLLPVSAYDESTRRPVISSGFRECDAWRLLAARGSERAVLQCIELIRWAKLDPLNAAEFLTVALGPEPVQPDVEMFSTDTRLVRGAALPQAARAEAVAVFAQYLEPNNRPADLASAVRGVPSQCVKDLREPLAALVAHPVHAVATAAHRRLETAGLTTGQETIAPATPPLRFRIVLNGKPLSGVKLSADALAARTPDARGPPAISKGADVTITANSDQGGDDPPFSRVIEWSRDLTTDGNGELTYSLEDCLEPERIASVQLRMGPPAYSSDWSELDVHIPGLASDDAPNRPDDVWPGPWIVHEVEVHAGDERVHEVDLRSADLEVKLASVNEMTPETPVKIMLRRAGSQEPFSPGAGVAKTTAKAGTSAFFRRLQPGKYTLCVKAPGAARYDSDGITLDDATVTHEVRLEPGRNVRGTAVFHEDIKSSLVLAAHLFRDGVEIMRDDIDEWKGLSFGKYTAHISSTREWEEKARRDGVPPTNIAEEDRTDAWDLSFMIDASTPATLDLGEIVVPRETPQTKRSEP